MKLAPPILLSKAASLALAILIAGCPASPPCEVDEAQIVINEGSTPTVPDQIVSGCFSVSVVRTYANDAERELIFRAEAVPSTKGPDPFNEAVRSNFEIFSPVAVNSESLTYYVQTVRSFRTGTYTPIPGHDPLPSDAGLDYTAEIVQADGPGEKTVHLTLSYIEYVPSFFPGAYASWSFFIARDVVFNAEGSVLETLGDGNAIPIAGN